MQAMQQGSMFQGGYNVDPGSPTRMEAGMSQSRASVETQACGFDASNRQGLTTDAHTLHTGVHMGAAQSCLSGSCGSGCLLPPSRGYGPVTRPGSLMDPRNYVGTQWYDRQVGNGRMCSGTGWTAPEVSFCQGCQAGQVGASACGAEAFNGVPGGTTMMRGNEAPGLGCYGQGGLSNPGMNNGAGMQQHQAQAQPQGWQSVGACFAGDTAGNIGQQGCDGGCRYGAEVGGMTPQMERYQEVVRLVNGLNPVQVMMLRQVLTDGSHLVRVVPETFGHQFEPSSPGAIPFTIPELPSMGSGWNGLSAQNLLAGGSTPVDVFAKTEKWLGNPPMPNTSAWVNREMEILGWATYLNDLTAWAMQASLEFGSEIEHASKWPTSLGWMQMTGPQKARSMRLMAILRSSFQGHPRTMTLINAFSEGIDLGSSTTTMSSQQASNGFELARQLTLEYSIRTRSEALAFRSALAGKTVTLSNAETSPATRVTDVIRKIDYELARFSKLLRTLSTSIDSAGLAVSEADMVALLLRSLPEVVRTFCVHHASGESYQAFRWTALKWEQQQRTFEEFQPKKPLNVLRPSDGNAARFDLTVSDSDGQWNLDAVQDDSRCAVCGSRKHVTAECTTDVTKIKCFRCQKFGHVSANCPDRKKADEGKAGVLKGKGKQKGKGKAKGTGKGFGKKGKLNELECEHDVVDLWYEDDGSWWSDTTWFQTSQVWAEEEIPSHEAWTDPWTDWTWQESWYETETEDQSQAVQSLVLSPLLEDTKGSLSGPVEDLSLQLVQGTMCDQESLVFPCFSNLLKPRFIPSALVTLVAVVPRVCAT